MPELPDITVYIEALEKRVASTRLVKTTLVSAFVLRSVDPPLRALEGRTVTGLRRLGKRIVFAFEDELFLVLHLMVSGRLRWKDVGAADGKKGAPPKLLLARFEFERGTLAFTEAASKKRASIHVVRGEEGLAQHDRGGLEVLEADRAAFAETLARESHTLKRTLTDPTLFSGIGNAYSDEILHRARLSPMKLSRSLDDEELDRLFGATRDVLLEWTARLRDEVGAGFPTKVTAFRDGMAVHGKFGEPCPVCGTAVQRIVYAENEANYCARCQTVGKLLADRALSRLMKQDWPRTVEEMENRKRGC
ncbi:MAG: Fpg/Nei family DNA glycosylase [Planctomycetota bacterium]